MEFPVKKYCNLYCSCLILFDCGGFFEVSQSGTVNELLSHIYSVRNSKTVSRFKSCTLCFTNSITQRFLHYCCILADGDVSDHHLLPPFLLACFSPDTEFLTPVQWALIKTRRMNKGTSNPLEPPPLDTHSCSGPGAALRDFSPWQTRWELARWKHVLPLLASRDSRFCCFWTHCHWPIINCIAAASGFFFVTWVLEISRKVQKNHRIKPFISEGVTTGHRSLGPVSWHSGSWQQTGCPSFSVQLNTAARGVKAHCTSLSRTGYKGSITWHYRFCHQKKQNWQQPPAATIVSAV